MAIDIAARFGLGPIGQIAYVVNDMEEALARYGALYGPFEHYTAKLDECLIRGEVADCTLHVATNNEGPIEVELIAGLEGHPPHADHLREHGEGLHHVRFDVEDVEAVEEELRDRFGDVPDAAMRLIALARVRELESSLGYPASYGLFPAMAAARGIGREEALE